MLSDDLVGRLLELADSLGGNHPPTADHIRNEVAAVTNGLGAPARDGGGHEAVQGFMASQAVIQHVDTVNIHVTSAHADGRDPQGLPSGPMPRSSVFLVLGNQQLSAAQGWFHRNRLI